MGEIFEAITVPVGRAACGILSTLSVVPGDRCADDAAVGLVGAIIVLVTILVALGRGRRRV